MRHQYHPLIARPLSGSGKSSNGLRQIHIKKNLSTGSIEVDRRKLIHVNISQMQKFS